MNFTSAATLVLVSAVAGSARAEEHRHHVSVGVTGGVGLVSKYVYDQGDIQGIALYGVTGEYAYRFGKHVSVGVEGARLYGKEHAVTLWTAMPVVGLRWGEGVIQGGVLLGLGYAHGGREVPATFQRTEKVEEPGLSGQVMGELALVSTRFDLVARTGFRYTRIYGGDLPDRFIYARDLRALTYMATLGVRVKF